MNKSIIRHIVFFLCGIQILCGCREAYDAPGTQRVVISGKNCRSFHGDASRSEESSLPEGTSISFFSEGNIIADHEELTLSQNEWQSTASLRQDAGQETTSFCALHPAFAGTAPTPYRADGSLVDVLYDRQEGIRGSSLTLEFKHLFSKIVFQLAESLNPLVSYIEFTPTRRIESVGIPDLQITYSDTDLPTERIDRQESRLYSLIIPPASGMGIDISIHTLSGETKQVKLSERDFEQGHRYVCTIKCADNEPGIGSVEDFIAFSRLINGGTYQNRTLDEFGSLEDGTMVYRLKSDLHFTEEQSREVNLLGYTQSGFSDCFDGQGHTLYDLVLTPQGSSKYPGLFAVIAKEGVVKDLRLENLQYTHTIKKDYVGILCGINRGTIHNCHVRNCVVTVGISSSSAYYVGGLASCNWGMICDSACDGCTFSGTKTEAAGLTATVNAGKVVNCYTVNSVFSKCAKSSSIAGEVRDGGSVYNCYAASNKHCKKGSFVYTATKSVLLNCFLHTSEGSGLATGSGNQTDIRTFDDSSQTEVLGLLNGWISDEGKTLFPEHTFFTWREAENPPFVLVAD